MKRTLMTLATVAVAATLVMTGCKKDDPITPETPEEETLENVFAGTSWVSHMENSIVEQGIQMNISYDVSLDFLDTVNGEIFQDIYLEVPAFPAASQSMNETDAFTYTFTEDSVFLCSTYVDAQAGDTVVDSMGMAYDKEAKTLTLDFNDADMERFMGTTSVVFTLRESVKTIHPHPVSDAGKSSWHKLVEKVLETLGR